MSVRAIHRALSLAVLAVWLVQAITGTLSVFRWELDEASVGGEAAPVDWTALGRRIDQLATSPGSEVSSVWTSGTGAGRFDVYQAVNGEDRVLRLDGQGRVVRERSGDQSSGNGAGWDTLTSLHTSLLAGERGEWLIAISGVLLVTNILLGAKLAWPKRGTWGKVLLARPAGGGRARLYGWHRKVGLWFALPALLAAASGVLLVFEHGLETRLGAGVPDPPVAAAGTPGPPVGVGRAVETALAAFPGSAFAGVSLPEEEAPWYRVRVRSVGEVPRKWGASVVYVAAADGRVLARHDAATASWGRQLVTTLYPLHTGQIGGWPGRVLAAAVGLALIAMIVLGVALWAARRRVRAPGAGAPLRPAHSPGPDPSRD
ncbi:MAG: hypothetical protein AVDCRST_MAG31-1548 [uncultured Sphingomonas sp.]|uniref:PepSY domain-containing protein n=1 Tax=uncultured Sphingomonas sp. TaxID=158754 RepID=A0A6J4TDN5_9SPHN|nr:PepSY-associated TM helix domain-containing protein [uncultured Sphingomonas sp.]CAA9520460.1 MAG: hypothetical protein AVDCRST_MAG31-1548 [uncultured Sphingomonas sp.]